MKTTEAKWASRVAGWRDSGETAEAFAAGKGYQPTTLKWHAWRLRQRTAPKLGGSRSNDPSAFAMAKVVRVGPRPAATIAVTVGAARIEVTAGFDASLLRAVVASLGASS